MKIASPLPIAFFMGVAIASAIGDPTADLASPNPATRDKAAKILRHTYVATPRSRFEPLLQKIKAGQSKQALAASLAPYHARLEESSSMGMTWNDFYRLDASWVLHAWGPYQPESVEGAELVRRTEKFWIKPPADFVRTWTEYYANGQKMYEERHGDADGVNEIFFYDNGQPWCISTNTENTYYFRDGRVQPKDHVVGED